MRSREQRRKGLDEKCWARIHVTHNMTRGPWVPSQPEGPTEQVRVALLLSCSLFLARFCRIKYVEVALKMSKTISSPNVVRGRQPAPSPLQLKGARQRKGEHWDRGMRERARERERERGCNEADQERGCDLIRSSWDPVAGIDRKGNCRSLMWGDSLFDPLRTFYIYFACFCCFFCFFFFISLLCVHVRCFCFVSPLSFLFLFIRCRFFLSLIYFALALTAPQI